MHYITALGADPKLAVAHNSLGRLYLTQGQISQAIVQFGEALRLNPDYKEAEENLRVAKTSDVQFLQQRTIDFWLAALCILIWMTRGGTNRWVFL